MTPTPTKMSTWEKIATGLICLFIGWLATTMITSIIEMVKGVL